MNETATAVVFDTIDPKTGKPPESRIGSELLVRSLAQRYRDADQERAIRRSRIQKQLNGNPPYDEEKLKKTGQSDRSNVPFREGEGHVVARLTTYFNLIFDVPTLVTVTMKDPKLADRNYARVIAGKFSKMLLDWKGFLYNVVLHQKQMVIHGVGPVYWPDERDWRFKALQAGSFLVDSGADASLDAMENCVIRGQYKAHELFWKISATEDELKVGITDQQKQEIAKSHGWNVKVVRDLIVAANKGTTKRNDDQYQTSQWETIQQQIKNYDTIYSSTQSELINVDHVYIREFRGKVSHYIVSEEEIVQDYIFVEKNKYDDFSQAICLFFADIGEGSYHSVRGLGTRIFSHCAVNDRLKNNMVDGANLHNTLVLQGDISDIRRVRIGRYTIVPNNVKIVANAFQPDIEATVGVSRFLEDSLARSVGVNRPDIQDHGNRGMQTATGERIRLSREGRLEEMDIMLYYLYLDQMYNEIKRRVFMMLAEVDSAYESVKKFKDECRELGVPDAVLKEDAFDLEATRAIGFGSAAQEKEALSEVVSVSGHFPELGKRTAVKRYVSAVAGYRFAEEVMPDDTTASDPGNQHSFAVLENSIMEEGGNVLAGHDQLHIAHCEVHMEPLEQIAQMFMSTGGLGDNPLQTHDFFLGCLHHVAQHLNYMKDDLTRKPEYTDFMETYDQLLKVFTKMRSFVAEIQQKLAQQRQEQMQAMQGSTDPKIQVELAKLQNDFAIAQQKEAHREKMSEEKTQHMMAIKSALAEQKMNLEAGKAGQ